MTKEEIDEIKSWEENYAYQYIINKSRISEGEKQNGMFGYMRDKILKEKALLLPFYKDKQIELLISVNGRCRTNP